MQKRTHTTQTPGISIIIPVKDENLNIQWTVMNIKKSVHYPYEIIVIYDDETDPTVDIVKKLNMVTYHIKPYMNMYGKGVINAIRTGLVKARGDVLVVMAADRTDDPKTIDAMYLKIMDGYDLICPTRYSRGGRVIGRPSIKSLLSRLSGLSTPYVLGLPTSDLTYSFKMFKKTLLDTINIESKGGFEFSEELVLKAFYGGYKITEVPTLWTDRTLGTSKFQLVAWLPHYIYWYIWGIRQRVHTCFLKS